MTKPALNTLWLALMLAGGCVEDASSTAAEGGSNPLTGPILPWKVGNSWTYRVTDDGVVSGKVNAIEAEEAVGGTGPHKDQLAYRVVTLKEDGTDQTISWQAPLNDEDSTIVRYREQSFDGADGAVELEEHWDPYKLHIDGSAAHSEADATWLEEYSETKLPNDGTAASTSTEHDRWTVDQADATVTVPAGTFQHAIVFTKAGGEDLKTYWYVRGIGKVKETGSQTEELASYELK